MTALGSSLQGMDELPPEGRSSSAVLDLLDYVFREMDSSDQTRVSQSEKGDLETFCAQLRDVIEGDNYWSAELVHGDLIH